MIRRLLARASVALLCVGGPGCSSGNAAGSAETSSSLSLPLVVSGAVGPNGLTTPTVLGSKQASPGPALANLGAGWVNVRDFGAKADGSDDWSAIQAAIAAVPLGGGVLYFPPGVYAATGPVYIANRSHFVVLGDGATIKTIDSCQPTVDTIEQLTSEIAALEAAPAANFPLPLPSQWAHAEQLLAADQTNLEQSRASLALCRQDHPPYLWTDPDQRHPNAFNNGPSHDQKGPRFFSSLEIYNCSDWRVVGLTLDGNYFGRGAAPASNGAVYQWDGGLDVAGGHRFTVESVQVQYCQGDGIVLHPIDTDPGAPPCQGACSPFFPSATDVSQTAAQTVESNSSEFALRDIRAHNLAGSSITVIGARNGVIDGLTDEQIGTDYDHSTGGGGGSICDVGGNSAVHIECPRNSVGASEYDYTRCEDIDVTNVTARNHGITAAALFDISSRAHFISFSHFVYEQDAGDWSASPGAVWRIVSIGSANNPGHVDDVHDISLSNGAIHVAQPFLQNFLHTPHDNRRCIGVDGGAPQFLHDTRAVEAWGIQLETGSGHVTIEGVTVDGPDIGIDVDPQDPGFENTPRHIRIVSNVVRNTSHYALWLNGGCDVAHNQLLDVTGSGGLGLYKNGSDAFVRVGDVSAVNAPNRCEHNPLRETGVSNPAPTYFSLNEQTTNFSAARNHCYGLSGHDLNAFHGSTPASFAENVFGDKPLYSVSGSFVWTPNVALARVPNTNVTPFTQVLVFPKNQAAVQLVRDHGISVTKVSPYESFEVGTVDGRNGQGTEHFGFHLM